MLIKYGEKFNSNNKSIIIFNHIPKCGGTTFNSILYEQLYVNYDAFYLLYNDILGIIFLSRIKKYLRTKKRIILTGHFSWNTHLLFENEVRNIYYITILRNPWNRIISQYQYLIYNDLINENFDLHLKKNRNFLTNFLAHGDLELAKENLANKYYLFGIMENYDDFLKMFGYYFGLRNIEYKIQNALRPFMNNENKFKDYKSIFEANNQKDIELYHWASMLFKKRIKNLSNKIHLIKTEPTSINKATKFTKGQVVSVSTNDLVKIENHLKQRMHNNPLGMLDQLITFYRFHNLWEKYVGLIDSLCDIINKYSKYFSGLDYFIKEIVSKYGLSNREEFIKKRKLDERKIAIYKLEFDKYFNEVLDHEIKKIKSTMFKNYNKQDVLCFLKESSIQKIGFYGISTRFIQHYQKLKKHMHQYEICLFDSDKGKHGKKFDKYVINSPEKIIDINPEIIIITSAFYPEIYEFLKKLKNQHKLDFIIANLENFIIYMLDF